MAGRDKDLEYLQLAVTSGLLDCETLLDLIDATPADPERRERARERIRGLFASS